MKNYTSYILTTVIFLAGVASIQAQEKNGTISATCELKAEDSNKVIGNKYAIKGTILTAQIRSSKPDIEGKQVIDSTFYRIYNNNEEIVKLAEEGIDSLSELNVGEEQTLKYKVTYTLKDGNSGEEAIYPSKDDPEITTGEFSFSIYNDDGYNFEFGAQPGGENRYTYKGCEKEVKYSIKVEKNEDIILPPYRIDWIINNGEAVVNNGNDCTYQPDSAGKFTYKAHIVFLNPGEQNKEWFSGSEIESDTLTVYPKLTLTEIIKEEPGDIKEHTTYCGKECKYNITVEEPQKFGNIEFEWFLNDVKQEEEANTYTFTPGNNDGVEKYSISAKVVCKNPYNESVTWYTETIEFDSLTVYLNPNSIDFDDKRIYSYPTGIQRYSHTGQNQSDREKEYSISIPDSIKYGSWKYKWTVKKDGQDYNIPEDSKNKLTIPGTIEPGTYTTSLKLTCFNPKDPTNEWYNKEISDFEACIVYNKPSTQWKDLHIDGYGGEEHTYSTYKNLQLDCRKLYTIDNNYGGLNNTSIFIMEGESWKKQSNNTISWESTGEKQLKIKVEYLIPDDNNGHPWDDDSCKDSIEYTIKVYEEPTYDIQLKVGNNVIDGSEVDIMYNQEQQVEEKITFNFILKGGNSNNWNVIADDTYQNSEYLEISKDTAEPNLFEAKGKKEIMESSAIKCTPKFEITNTPPDIINEHKYNTKVNNITINLWKNLGINIEKLKKNNNGHYVMEVCNNLKDKEVITLSNDGGYYNKWDIVWSSEDTYAPSIPNGYTATFSDLTVNEDKSIRTYHYKVGTSYDGGRHPETFYIDIIVYPMPTVDMTIKLKEKEINTDEITYEIKNHPFSSDTKLVEGKCYENDIIEIVCQCDGGMPSAQGAWKYEYDHEGKKDIENGTISISFENIKNFEKDLAIYYEHPGENYTSETTWYKGVKHVLNFEAFPRPEINPALTDSTNIIWSKDNRVDVYAGGKPENNVNFKYNHINDGYPEGWACTWTVVDNNNGVDSYITKATEWSYVPTAEAGSEEKTIKVHIENRIGNNKGLVKEYEYPIKVWRKTDFPDILKITDKENILRDENNQFVYDIEGAIKKGREISSSDVIFQTRDGNHISGVIESMMHGYIDNNSYKYKWNRIESGAKNTEVENELTWETDVLYSPDNNSEKGIITLEYELEMINLGPYGNTWDCKKIPYEIKIYNKPKTPTSIIQKGDGTSHTMTATASISDQDLQGHEYYLVFGYTDEDGKEHDFSSRQQLTPGQVRWSAQFDNQQQMKNAYVYAVWKYGDGVEISSGKCLRRNDSSIVDTEYDSSTYNGNTRAAIYNDYADVINTIHNHSQIRSVYNLNGIRVSKTLMGLKAGIYIVEFADGATSRITLK